MMSRWCGHRNIPAALIFKCMCASVRVLHSEAPAALFLSLSLENHSLSVGRPPPPPLPLPPAPPPPSVRHMVREGAPGH